MNVKTSFNIIKQKVLSLYFFIFIFYLKVYKNIQLKYKKSNKYISSKISNKNIQLKLLNVKIAFPLKEIAN